MDKPRPIVVVECFGVMHRAVVAGACGGNAYQ